MEQCIQMLAQAIQSGQLDPNMPVGALVQQAMGGQQGGQHDNEAAEAQQAPQGLGQVQG